MTIWKFPLQMTDYQVIKMPAGAEILTIQVQHGKPCIWAHVTAENELEARHFIVAGTGHALPDWTLKYIGTFQIEGGALVFHVLETRLR